MHINYCITSNQRVTPLKSVNLNIHQLYKPVPGSKKVRKADQEKLRENRMGVGKHGVVESEKLFNTSFRNMIGHI